MKKLLLTSGALAAAALVSFFAARPGQGPVAVEAQGAAKVFPKVEIAVRIDGIDGEFRAGLSGLGVDCEVIEERDPAGGPAKKRPGRVKYGDITLKRGYLGEDAAIGLALFKWFEAVKGGQLEKKAGVITMREAAGLDYAQYEFHDAWPCKWKGARAPDASAAFTEEEFQLIVQKVRRVK